MSLVKNFIGQIRRNPRLRWGVWLMVWIVWLYGVLELRDYLDAENKQYQSILSSVSRLRAESAQPEWLARVDPARKRVAGLESKLWQASSEGLATAAVQDWLGKLLTGSGVTEPQIKTAVIEEEAGKGKAIDPLATDLWRVRGNLSFSLDLASLMDLLFNLEYGDHQVVIESLTVGNLAVPRVEIQLVALVHKQADAILVLPEQQLTNPTSTPPVPLINQDPQGGATARIQPANPNSAVMPVNPFATLSGDSAVAPASPGNPPLKNPFLP